MPKIKETVHDPEVPNHFRPISNRIQTVVVDGVSSKPTPLTCCVPQGLVLGEILFNIYTLPLGDILKKMIFRIIDIQMIVKKIAIFELTNYDETVVNMEVRASDIRQWYTQKVFMCKDPQT